MLITNVEEKKELLERFYGKFYTKSIEDINYKSYLELMKNIDFIKSYDNYIIAIERPKIHYYTTLYYNNNAMPNGAITEEEFIEYHLHQFPTYSKDFWITKEDNRISYITKKKTNNSLRQLTIIELNEINELLEKYKKQVLRALRMVYNTQRQLITRYEVWEKKKRN